MDEQPVDKMIDETSKPAKAKKFKRPPPLDIVDDQAAAAAAYAEAQMVEIAAQMPGVLIKTPLTLLQRLSAVQNEVDYVQKEKRQGMRYSIVSHDAVTAKVRPVLVKHGVLYYPLRLQTEQFGNRTQAFMVVRFVNVDDKDDFIDVQTFGYGIDESDKGPGKAMSYAVKYALLKCLGMETGDDPDLDQDVVHKVEPGVQQGAAAAAARNDVETPMAAANKQHEEDAVYVEGLTLRMAKAISKEQLTKLHVDTKTRREEIAARSPQAYKQYLDAMKQRASEIDARSQG